MQCPKCKYDPTLTEMQSSPDDCVKCGINYAGYTQSLARAAEAKAAQERLNPTVRSVSRDFNGAQPVVVIGVEMGFWQLVRFMVKFILASIPAIVIAGLLIFFMFSFFSGLSIGIAKYFPSKAPVSEVAYDHGYELVSSKLSRDSKAIVVVSKDNKTTGALLDCSSGLWASSTEQLPPEAPTSIGRIACKDAVARHRRFR